MLQEEMLVDYQLSFSCTSVNGEFHFSDGPSRYLRRRARTHILGPTLKQSWPVQCNLSTSAFSNRLQVVEDSLCIFQAEQCRTSFHSLQEEHQIHQIQLQHTSSTGRTQLTRRNFLKKETLSYC